MGNTSLTSKDTELLSVLQQYFKGDINLARLRLISFFILALCKVKSINYDKLACGFDTKATKGACYRRIQRFMADFDLPMKLISRLIFSILPEKINLTLVLDRTNWKFGTININILMLGVAYKNMAFPLMFLMLEKRGNSSTEERIKLLTWFIDWFGVDCIDCLLADREFIGEKWLAFLNQHQIGYHIRIRNNFWFYSYQKQEEIRVSHIFNHLKVGYLHHYPKIVRLHGQDCYLSGLKTVDEAGKIELLILVSFNKAEQSIAAYKNRWQVETLFRALKTSGFNIESTHVTDLKRLEKLFLLTMIAMVWCYKIGDYIDQNIKKIPIKTHERRAVSVFKYGLDYLSKVLLTQFNTLNINLFQFLSCT